MDAAERFGNGAGAGPSDRVGGGRRGAGGAGRTVSGGGGAGPSSFPPQQQPTRSTRSGASFVTAMESPMFRHGGKVLIVEAGTDRQVVHSSIHRSFHLVQSSIHHSPPPGVHHFIKLIKPPSRACIIIPQSLNTVSHHSLSTQYLNTVSHHSLSPQSLDTNSHHNLSTQSLNTVSQHSLSTQSLSTQSLNTVSLTTNSADTVYVWRAYTSSLKLRYQFEASIPV